MKIRIALVSAVAAVLVGLLNPTPPAMAGGGDPFCQSAGYNIWCGLADKIIVGKGYFQADGDYCRVVKNGYSSRKAVALDIGGSLGSFHKIRSGKRITVCEDAPDKLVRATLRVRMDREVQRAAGTWLVANDSTKRVVTFRKVPTASSPSVKLCAKNTTRHKSMLYMYWDDREIDHTAKHIRRGRVGCVSMGLAGSGSAEAKFVWMNPYNYRGIEAWVIRA